MHSPETTVDISLINMACKILKPASLFEAVSIVVVSLCSLRKILRENLAPMVFAVKFLFGVKAL